MGTVHCGVPTRRVSPVVRHKVGYPAKGQRQRLLRLLREVAVQCRRGTMQRMAEDKAGKGRAGGVWASAWVRLNLRYCDRT